MLTDTRKRWFLLAFLWTAIMLIGITGFVKQGSGTLTLTNSGDNYVGATKVTAGTLALGADEVIISTDANEMQRHAFSFDFILDTVSADHDINAYLNLLKIDGTLTLVGAQAAHGALVAGAHLGTSL